MRVFIDTNVLVDMMVRERPSYPASRSILRAAEESRITLVFTGLTLVNALYAIRKAAFSRKELRAILDVLLSISDIASTDMPQLQAALDSDWSDFEDAVQYQAALSAGRVEAIVTSDAKGFKGSRIPVVTPEEFLERLL